MNQLGVAVIGAGIMANSHAEKYEAIPETQVVGVFSLTEKRAREFSQQHHCKVYKDWEEVLNDSNVQIISVATPDFAHTQYVVEAARSGRHVLVEKPLALSTADARSMIDAARANGTKLMTLFNHRWVAPYWNTKQQIENGSIGQPIMMYARKNDRIFVPTEMISWADQTTSAYFLSSHDIDLINWYVDSPPVEVSAREIRQVLVKQGIDSPDGIVIQVTYENGAVATFESCWTYPNKFPSLVDSFLEVIGADGVIHLDRKIEQMEMATKDRFEYPKSMLDYKIRGELAGAVYMGIKHFVQCCLRDEPVLVTPESSLTVTAVLEAAHESIHSGEYVKVEDIHGK